METSYCYTCLPVCSIINAVLFITQKCTEDLRTRLKKEMFVMKTSCGVMKKMTADSKSTKGGKLDTHTTYMVNSGQRTVVKI